MFLTQVETTNRCNLKCPYCVRTIHPPDLRDMTYSEMEHVFRELLTWPFAAKERVALCGHGEPLLNQSLYSLLENQLLEAFPDIWIITNGVMLSDRWIKRIVDSGVVNFVQVSLQSAVKESFDQLQVGADFDTVVENTRSLIEAVGGTRTKVRVQYLRTRINPSEGAKDFEALLNTTFSNQVRFHHHPVGDLFGSGFPGAMKTRPVCWNRFGRNLIINAYGDLVGCCWDNTRKQSYGSIFKESLLSLRGGELLRALREELVGRDLHRLPLCRGCFSEA